MASLVRVQLSNDTSLLRSLKHDTHSYVRTKQKQIQIKITYSKWFGDRCYPS